jgi:hypothetical protein
MVSFRSLTARRGKALAACQRCPIELSRIIDFPATRRLDDYRVQQR